MYKGRAASPVLRTPVPRVPVTRRDRHKETHNPEVNQPRQITALTHRERTNGDLDPAEQERKLSQAVLFGAMRQTAGVNEGKTPQQNRTAGVNGGKTRQQNRTTGVNEGKTPQQPREAGRKPRQTASPAPQGRTHAKRKPSHQTRSVGCAHPRAPIPNSAFPPRSPARTNACAGAITGRHLSPRRPAIHEPVKRNILSSRQRGQTPGLRISPCPRRRPCTRKDPPESNLCSGGSGCIAIIPTRANVQTRSARRQR